MIIQSTILYEHQPNQADLPVSFLHTVHHYEILFTPCSSEHIRVQAGLEPALQCMSHPKVPRLAPDKHLLAWEQAVMDHSAATAILRLRCKRHRHRLLFTAFLPRCPLKSLPLPGWRKSEAPPARRTAFRQPAHSRQG